MPAISRSDRCSVGIYIASKLNGLYRFDVLWIGLAEGPDFDDYLSGSGEYAEQALRRLADRLRERRGSAYG